jgi:hypothetical protein
MFIEGNRMKTENMDYIAEVFALGGNSPVDFVILKDGRVLGISDECVVLYDSMSDFDSFEHKDRKAFCL